MLQEEALEHKSGRMRGKFWLAALIAGAGLYLMTTFFAPSESETLSGGARHYFKHLYADTWNYLAVFVEPQTGMPYDSSAKQPVTSLSNVGLYLASTAVAFRTELISRDEAKERIGKCLSSLEKVETWRGFPRPWFLVRSLRATHGDEFSYGSHLSLFLGGLIVAKSTFPEFTSEIDTMLHRMDFKSLYDAQTGWLHGGYNMKTQNFAIFQSWGHWYYKYFASETRLLSFYLIARRAAPPRHWKMLIRPLRREEGETFFVSGPEEGGLFTQYAAALFLDERNFEIGKSEKNYARFQIKRAKKIKAPVWGWSSSEAPSGRYLAYGELKDEIVAPYASILASIYFPEETLKNLQELEKLGARPAHQGFLDSVNWQTGEVAKHYLTPAQGMAFLSLANLLYDGVVWKTFAEDSVVRDGMALLGKRQ